MSKINHRRKDTWKIKIRKPVSIRPSKVMDDVKYNRHKIKQQLNNLLRGITNATHKE